MAGADLISAMISYAVSQSAAIKSKRAAHAEAASAAQDPANLIGGIGYGPAGYSPLTNRPGPILQARIDAQQAILDSQAASIDVSTPVSFTPAQPILGEQQQLHQLVNKPSPRMITPAQIAQAEPTRMVMQAQASLVPNRITPRRTMLRSQPIPGRRLRNLIARKRRPSRKPIVRRRR